MIQLRWALNSRVVLENPIIITFFCYVQKILDILNVPLRKPFTGYEIPAPIRTKYNFLALLFKADLDNLAIFENIGVASWEAKFTVETTPIERITTTSTTRLPRTTTTTETSTSTSTRTAGYTESTTVLTSPTSLPSTTTPLSLTSTTTLAPVTSVSCSSGKLLVEIVCVEKIIYQFLFPQIAIAV